MRRGPPKAPRAPAHCREGPCPAVPAGLWGVEAAKGTLVPNPAQG